jgi:hypothetical protein
MTYQQLKVIARKLVYMNYEVDFLPVILATVIANRLDTHPVWLMVVAGPSAGKTVLVNALRLCDEALMISMLTPKTLISGAKLRDTVDGKEPSLMARLDGKVMIIKDASTITEMDRHTRGEVYSQLRTAFDGNLEKDTGLGRKEFKAKFGLIIAGTPKLERLRSFESELGERFLTFRPAVEEEEQVWGLSDAVQNVKRKLDNQLAEAMKEYLATCGVPEKILTPKEIRQYATFLVKLRAVVSRDSYGRYVDYPVDDGQEAPFRVGQQLGALYTALVHVTGNPRTSLHIIKRVILDSVPYTRLRLMQCLQRGLKTQADVAKSMKMSVKAVSELVDSMEHLEYIQVKFSGNSKIMRVNPYYKKLFTLCSRL